MDGYDLFILESMRNHGVVQVITDDGGFATVPNIQVSSINRKVIQAARDADWLCDGEFVYDFFGKMERKGHWK